MSAAGARSSTSARPCAPRGWRSGPRSCSTRSRRCARSRWTERGPFREALAATLAKSPDDRRVFDLVFERFFFRAVGGAGAYARDDRARRRATDGDGDRPAASRSTSTTCASRRCRPSATATSRRCATSPGSRSPPSARRGEGSGVLGVDVQRIRRALEPARDRRAPREDGARAAHPRPDPALRAAAAARARARRRSSARRQLPPARPLNELDRALPVRAAAGPRRRAPGRRRSSSGGSPPRATRRAGAAAHAHVDVRRTMRASLQTGGVPVELKFRPQRPRRPELYVLCDVSTSVTSASVFFLSRPARPARLVPQDALVRVRRADLGGHRRLRARAQLQGGVARRSARDAGVADVSGYTDYGRVWREFLDAGRRRPAPARDRDRARRRAHQRPRPARRRVRAASPREAGRTFWLNPEPQLYWNYGDSVVRAYAPFCELLRVLDDASSSRTS